LSPTGCLQNTRTVDDRIDACKVGLPVRGIARAGYVKHVNADARVKRRGQPPRDPGDSVTFGNKTARQSRPDQAGCANDENVQMTRHTHSNSVGR
jgi:hypothetical protein